MMRCVVLITSLLLAATASRADDSVLRLDNDLFKDAVASIIDNDTDGQVAANALPIVMALPAQYNNNNNNNNGRSLPPQLNGIGLGLQVGAPTAITIKFAGLQANGFVVGVGAGFAYGRGNRYYGYNNGFASLSIHADYLWHLATLVSNSDVALTFYAGVGLWLSMFGNGYGYGLVNPYYNNAFIGVGVRVPLGLSLGFSGAPIEIYLEADPAFFIFPGIDFGIGASLGFRFHF